MCGTFKFTETRLWPRVKTACLLQVTVTFIATPNRCAIVP